MAVGDNLLIKKEDEGQEIPPASWPAFGLPLIEDIPNPIPVEQLLDANSSEVIQKLVYEAIRVNSNRDAIELIHRLRLLENLKSFDKQAYNLYHNFIILLRFVSFISRKQKDAKILLNEGLVQAMRAGVEVVNNIKDYFNLYEGETGVNKEMRRELAYSLENNKENIGSQSLILDEQGSVVPTLQNWLKSYNQAQPLVNERSKFNEINFINMNSNVRKLAGSEKKLLGEILEIYDFLLFPPILKIDVNRLNTEVQAVNAGQYLTVEKFVLPESARADVLSSPPQSLPALPTTSPGLRPPSPHPSSTADESARYGAGKEREIRAGGEVKPTSKPVNPVKSSEGGVAQQPFNRVNIQDILNRKPGAGISFGGANLNAESVKKEYEERQKVQTAQIDRKLENLKKRISNNANDAK